MTLTASPERFSFHHNFVHFWTCVYNSVALNILRREFSQTLAQNEVHPTNDMHNYLWVWSKKFQHFTNSNTVENFKLTHTLCSKLSVPNSN